MVGKAPEGGVSTSSLVSLLPRQVMLESCGAGAVSEAAGKKVSKRRKGEREEERSLSAARVALLRAIAAFLERSGFSRTLYSLRSEAEIEIEDGSMDLDLEGIVCKYLELREDSALEKISIPDEQDAQNRTQKEGEGIHDHSEEHISKKKKKRKKEKVGDDNVKTESDKAACEGGVALPNHLVDELLGRKVPDANHETGENQLLVCHVNSEDHKRKKSKKVCKETIESVSNEKPLDEERLNELVSLPENAFSLLDETNIGSKDTKKKKKKKKDKLTSDLPHGVVNQVELETSQEEKGKSEEFGRKTDSQMPTFATENATSDNLIKEDISKGKEKKKRRHKLIVENSSGGPELQNGTKYDERKKETSMGHDIEGDAKEFHPNVEDVSFSNAGNIDKKAKKPKRSVSEQTELHIDNDAVSPESKERKLEYLKQQKGIEETEKPDDSLLKRELCTPGKKRKREKSQEDSEKSFKMPVKEKSEVPKDAKETPAAGREQNEMKGQPQINGNLEKSKWEGNGSLKSDKEELKGSAEPKTVNAFKRVKIDEVKFADKRLQDNSYWAKHGAETGYGAKAQDVLGQVRGRDFRHEKTKKKRGSYRGGQIDFQSHSVKFNYSDDDE